MGCSVQMHSWRGKGCFCIRYVFFLRNYNLNHIVIDVLANSLVVYDFDNSLYIKNIVLSIKPMCFLFS